jgi:transcriptional regulator with XRE-family HTH domain
MPEIHVESRRGPSADVRLLAVEAWRRAEAMGLLGNAEDGQAARQLDRGAMTRLFNRVRAAGIARGPALRLDNVETPSNEDLASMLRLVIAALEASPVAKYEWPAVTRVFEPERLADLLGISLSSLRRYLSGSRDTPDEVAARLHHLALIVGDLAGAYNDVGIRRWFDRRRSALAGRSPSALLAGEWNPEDKGPQQVRALAQSLTALAAT